VGQVNYIAEESAPLRALAQVNREMVQGVGQCCPDQKIATLDLDSPYYRMTQDLPLLQLPLRPLWGLLFAPSRGLFISSPFLLVVLLRLWPSNLRKHPFTAVEIALGALAVAYWAGAAKWPFWWGGGSFGPRPLCEVLPCLIVLMIPIVWGCLWRRAPRARHDGAVCDRRCT
jgi:hypothetical protein